MPYTDPFDPSLPNGAHSLGQGDDDIRANWRGLEERLATLTNFPTGEPLRLLPGVIDNRNQIAGALAIPFIEYGTYSLAAGINVGAGAMVDNVITLSGLTTGMLAYANLDVGLILLTQPLSTDTDKMLIYRLSRVPTGVGGAMEIHLQILNFTGVAITTVARTLTVAVLR